MPFFDHPADPTSWLLPLVSGMLQVISLIFRAIASTAPYGIAAVAILVVALFSMNLMKDPYPS